MDDTVADRLAAPARVPTERAALVRAVSSLDERDGLSLKVAREPELVEILEEFIGRLQRAFGSLEHVQGKRVLDIASGSNSSRSPATGKRTALFEPWFARLVLELGGAPVALDSGDLERERFEHHQVDLGRAGALDFLPAASFDGVQDSRLFGSPEFRKAYPRRRDHERVKAEIARQERRVLKPDGVLIHSDNPRP
jgi:SAM-dependent methyltransferase